MKIYKGSLLVVILLILTTTVYAEVVLVNNGLIFIETDDPKKCNDGLYPSERDLCFKWNAIFHSDQRLCELVEQKGARENCYHLLAVYSKNPEFCKKTGIYEDNCNLELRAILEQNPTVCEEFANPPLCYQYVSLIYDDWDLCYEFYGPSQCLMNIIQKKNDIELCKEVRGDHDNSFCYAYFAIKEEKAEYCDLADTPESCYYATAFNLVDKDLCQKAGRDDDDCIMRVALEQAVKSKDIANCDNPEIDWRRENCLVKFAIINEYPGICEELNDQYCLDYIEAKKNASSRNLDFISANKSVKESSNTVIIGIVLVGFLFILTIAFVLRKKIGSKRTNK